MLCTFGPPLERRCRFILKFEDRDMDDLHFDNEPEAIAAFRSYRRRNADFCKTRLRRSDMQPEQLPKRVRDYQGHLGTAVQYLGKGHYRVEWDEPPIRATNDQRVEIPSRTVGWDFNLQRVSSSEQLYRVSEAINNDPNLWPHEGLISDADLAAALRIAAAALQREGR